MPKYIKGLAGRKPPEPSASHDGVQECIDRHMPAMQPILGLLDETIRSSLPGVQYAVYRNRPYYGRPDLGWMIELAAYFKSVNVVFFGGADFDDPPPLGDTDRTRYVKLSSVEDAQLPQLRAWIASAGRTPGWR